MTESLERRRNYIYWTDDGLYGQIDSLVRGVQHGPHSIGTSVIAPMVEVLLNLQPEFRKHGFIRRHGQSGTGRKPA